MPRHRFMLQNWNSFSERAWGTSLCFRPIWLETSEPGNTEDNNAYSLPEEQSERPRCTKSINLSIIDSKIHSIYSYHLTNNRELNWRQPSCSKLLWTNLWRCSISHTITIHLLYYLITTFCLCTSCAASENSMVHGWSLQVYYLHRILETIAFPPQLHIPRAAAITQNACVFTRCSVRSPNTQQTYQ